MNRTRTITLELLLTDDSLSGSASEDGGARREFDGRLGLMHTIDELLATTPSRPTTPTDSGGEER
jgi:hypothetical protein